MLGNCRDNSLITLLLCFMKSVFCFIIIIVLFALYCSKDEVFSIWVCAFGLCLAAKKLWKRKVKSFALCFDFLFSFFLLFWGKEWRVEVGQILLSVWLPSRGTE